MKNFFYSLLTTIFLFITAGLLFAEPLVITEKQNTDLNVPEEALVLPPETSRRSTATMMLNFDLDSAAIKPEAAKVLDMYGKAMQSERLLPFKFDLEGHTDASGDEDYNMNLSQKRADAVKNYLIVNCGVAEQRLSSLGRGESAPLDPDDPLAEGNRRIELFTAR